MKMSATMDITCNVYGEEEAFWIVKLYAGSVLEIITRGKSSMKKLICVRTRCDVVMVKAQPSILRGKKTIPASAIVATAPSG